MRIFIGILLFVPGKIEAETARRLVGLAGEIGLGDYQAQAFEPIDVVGAPFAERLHGRGIDFVDTGRGGVARHFTHHVAVHFFRGVLETRGLLVFRPAAGVYHSRRSF